MTLKRTVFFPYAFEEDVLTVEILKLTVDGRERKGFIDTEQRLISLDAIPGWEVATVEVRCHAPEDLARKVLPANEWEAPGWSGSVIGFCGPTRWRSATPLLGKAFGPWDGTVTLRRSELHGQAALTGMLARSKDALRKTHAVRRGAKLATAPQWHVRIDEAGASTGKYLRVVWEDFSESAVPLLKANAQQVYLLEIEAEGGGPILWLNRAIDDLQPILDSKATHGPKAAARNALFDSIAQPVWLSLVIAAAKRLEDQEQDVDTDGEAPEGGWARSVLETVAPEVYPDESEDRAVRTLIEELASKDRHDEVLQRIGLAVQEHLSLRKSTLALIKTVEDPS